MGSKREAAAIGLTNGRAEFRRDGWQVCAKLCQRFCSRLLLGEKVYTTLGPQLNGENGPTQMGELQAEAGGAGSSRTVHLPWPDMNVTKSCCRTRHPNGHASIAGSRRLVRVTSGSCPSTAAAFRQQRAGRGVPAQDAPQLHNHLREGGPVGRLLRPAAAHERHISLVQLGGGRWPRQLLQGGHRQPLAAGDHEHELRGGPGGLRVRGGEQEVSEGGRFHNTTVCQSCQMHWCGRPPPCLEGVFALPLPRRPPGQQFPLRGAGGAITARCRQRLAALRTCSTCLGWHSSCLQPAHAQQWQATGVDMPHVLQRLQHCLRSGHGLTMTTPNANVSEAAVAEPPDSTSGASHLPGVGHACAEA